MQTSEQDIPQEAADALFAILVTRGSPKAAIAAALNAWPKAFHAPILDWKVNGPRPSTSDGFADMRQFAPHPAIILPLVKP